MNASADQPTHPENPNDKGPSSGGGELAPPEPVSAQQAVDSSSPFKPPTPRPAIKIGSQRQASGVIRAKPQPLLPPRAAQGRGGESVADAQAATNPTQPVAASEQEPGVLSTSDDAPPPPLKTAHTGRSHEQSASAAAPRAELPPPPSVREPLSEDLEQELAAAMEGLSLDAMLAGAPPAAAELEPESSHRGRVISVRHENVFIELPTRHQGIVPLSQFAEPPEPGTLIDVAVQRFNPAEGLYELTVPQAAVSVAGWSQLSEGMVVDAVVTGHNQGGLEVEVNKLRGFIPISHVSLYRVESLTEFVGQRLTCVVTEVNPDARNLVLSRRAMLERQRAEARAKLLDELEVGQTHEGVVTRLQPFGAFVDLGGVDGLIHVSQLSWDRVQHPSEVLEVGQRIKVRVVKLDRATGKIGLAYRDSWENPWETAAQRYVPRSIVSGTVSKLMDFGAFVRLEPGIEGLIHISELAHRRVTRPGEVVQEGQQLDVQVLSVNPEEQRISLSLKALQARMEPPKRTDEAEEPAAAPPPASKKKGPLKGGVDRPSGGQAFGLKW